MMRVAGERQRMQVSGVTEGLGSLVDVERHGYALGVTGRGGKRVNVTQHRGGFQQQ